MRDIEVCFCLDLEAGLLTNNTSRPYKFDQYKPSTMLSNNINLV